MTLSRAFAIQGSKAFFFSALLGVVSAGVGRAQIDLPLSNVGLAYPGISAVTIQLGGTSDYGLPTPFILQGLIPDSALWFCMDPAQTFYYNGSGLPTDSALHYASTNPSDFDKWTPLAPGLNAARIQNLADLFTAYAPTRTNQLTGGALQLAIWEIVNEFDENPFNLSSGQMTVSGDATLLFTAQAMLDSLGNVEVQGRGDSASLSFLIDGTYQPASGDAVLMQDLVGYTPVPEANTFALGATGLLFPMIWLKLRRRKQDVGRNI